MAETEFTDLVVGGIAPPRFLTLYDDNFVSNPRFNDEISEWETNNTNITLSRYEDSDAYHQYMLRAQWSTSLKSLLTYTYLEESGIILSNTSQKFLFALRIKDGSLSDGEEIITNIRFLFGNTVLDSRQIILTNEIKRVAVVFEGNWDSYSSSSPLKVQIETGIDFRASGDIRLDDVYFYEIKSDLQLGCTNQTNLLFQRDNVGAHELSDGKYQEYNRRWKPNYYGAWKILNKIGEKNRLKIAESPLLFVFPHLDYFWGFFGKWDGDYNKEYPFNRFIGSDAEVQIMGNEFLYGDIQPGEVEYIPPPTTYDIVISSTNPSYGVYITINAADEDGLSNGYTGFTREYEENTAVIFTAPASLTHDGETKLFSKWTNEVGTTISTSRSLDTTITSNDIFTAVYVNEEEPPATGGYGEAPYGGSDTVGYGDVF